MNKDIRISTTFPGHKKTLRLIRKFGVDGPWHLIKLWIWASIHCPDGNFEDMTDEDIEDACKWNGEPGAFIKALCEEETKFIVRIESAYVLHNWSKHNSWAAKALERSEIASKNAKVRWDRKKEADAKGMQKPKKPDAPSPSPSPSPSPKNKKKEDFVLEFPLDWNTNDNFRKAWALWEQHRKEIKKKLTPASVKLTVNKLTQYPVETAIEMIKNSVEKGYQGIFEVNGVQTKAAEAEDTKGAWG